MFEIAASQLRDGKVAITDVSFRDARLLCFRRDASAWLLNAFCLHILLNYGLGNVRDVA